MDEMLLDLLFDAATAYSVVLSELIVALELRQRSWLGISASLRVFLPARQPPRLTSYFFLLLNPGSLCSQMCTRDGGRGKSSALAPGLSVVHAALVF